MKTCLNNYKKCFLSVLLAVSAGLILAATTDPRPVFRFGFQGASSPQPNLSPNSEVLEGAWVAQTENGIRNLMTFALNSSGQSATFRNEMIWPPELLAQFALSGVTHEIGGAVMTGRNTARYTAQWYGLISGRPLVVYVDIASLTVNSPNELGIVHQVTGYDADPNGQPVGVPIAPTVTYNSTARRITQ